jgi:hypothetical protein
MIMSVETKAKKVLDQARAIASGAGSWADFSNALFDQRKGIVAKTFGTSIERQAFFDSPQYEEINQILLSLMKRFPPTADVAKKSGKLVVRMPSSTHETLVIEAKSERVSLNQLMVAKLSIPLRNQSKIKSELIVEAFAATHGGYASDRVIVDPELNPIFLKKCRELGVDASDFRINHLLYNIRKTPKLGKLAPTTKRSEFDDYDNYRFASEIAVRVLQRTRGVTLDRILCDPELRLEFDQHALSLVEETSKLKLRLAALNLRKTHNLKPLTNPQSPIYDLVSAGPIRRIDLSKLPDLEGTYVFYEGTRPIYAGETEHLRKRIGLHVSRGLPDWVDLNSLSLRYFSETKPKQAERLEWLMSFINRERPLLNYQKVA